MKDFICFKTEKSQVYLRPGKIIALEQSAENADFYNLSYHVSGDYVRVYTVLLIPEVCDQEFLVSLGLNRQETEVGVDSVYAPKPPLSVSYYGGVQKQHLQQWGLT